MIAALIAVGAGLSLCLGPAVLRIGRWPALLDVPGARSTHRAPVPRVGGLLIAAALVPGVALSLLLGLVGAEAGADSTASTSWLAYAVPALLYLGIGLADDLRRMRPRVKFGAQALAAAVAVALGLRWGGEALGPFGAISFGVLAPFMSWLWLVATVILVNFVDGIDLITAATTAVVLAVGAGAGAGPAGGALYALALGAVLGMAYYNRRPALLFPGDAGTHLLGFLVGSVALGMPGATAGAPWALAAAPLLPGVVDVFLGLVAKARRGVPLWAAHSEHLYQRLTKVGAPHARVALRYGALGVLAVVAVHPIGTGLGSAALCAFSLLVLMLHFAHAWVRTRRLPVHLATDSRRSAPYSG